MNLPRDVTDRLFDQQLRRGTIIRFNVDFDDGFSKVKYAVVLNATLPSETIVCILTTSKHEHFERNRQFEPALIRIPAGECGFSLDTILPVRNPIEVETELLKKQYGSGNLTFHGQLDDVRIAKMDAIVRVGLFIDPRMRSRILPPTE